MKRHIVMAVTAACMMPRLSFAVTPMGYLTGSGPKSLAVVSLTWGLLILSIAVAIIMTALVVAGVWVRRVRANGPVSQTQVERGGDGMRWLTTGLGLTSVALLVSLVWTVVVLAKVNGPSTPATLTIEITGQQWWWKARYLSDDVSRIFNTADEVHIPVGQPVRIRLISSDVVHSFWVPQLSGKLDAIPAQTNETWIEASKAGRYSGECSEFCGAQHAHMAFAVVADPPAQFQSWWDAQLRPAAAPSAPLIAEGGRNFEFHCGACHSVRGTAAGGTIAPDLTHLMSRGMIAGGALPNQIGNLAGWIANPQSIKPGTLMPNLYLSGQEITSVVAYLETLH